jgi:hypothetical protein
MDQHGLARVDGSGFPSLHDLIQIARMLPKERLLKQDAGHREYAARVRYRFIPLVLSTRSQIACRCVLQNKTNCCVKFYRFT